MNALRAYLTRIRQCSAYKYITHCTVYRDKDLYYHYETTQVDDKEDLRVKSMPYGQHQQL